jgi:glycosyltransferase involved in cell wall biosynthesis
VARCLFILKRRSFGYGNGYSTYNSSGLHNSARYVHEMLEGEGIPSKLVHVVDNNAIDREVVLFNPTHVFIEAYWVVPEKFVVLRRLHPNVKWVIRNHSEIPFLANEGSAIGWVLKYVAEENVMVSSNSPVATNSFRAIIKAAYPDMNKKEIAAKTPLLTNVYPTFQILDKTMFGNPVHIGCFGAVRPLKNQLMQAVAAIRYAEGAWRKLFFHINATRIEGDSGQVISNLRSLFNGMPRHRLVEHGWMDIDEFLWVVRGMHVVTQVSFSETFNFVAADAISEGTPIVVSSEIPWAVDGIADPNDDVDIAEKIDCAIGSRRNLRRNGRSLQRYSNESKSLWLDFLR